MKKLIFILIPLLLISCKGQIKEEQENRKAYIYPYNKNPGYWSYKGKPVLLLGASDNDNLFQMDTLIRHLDSIHSCGANYVRNTMSSRDPGNIWPFGRTGNGKYDLDIWNNRYWNKFHLLLKEAYKRDIIIQIEIWDRFDYSRDPWQKNPFNPKNNVNYSVERCGMETEYPEHPFKDLQPLDRKSV